MKKVVLKVEYSDQKIKKKLMQKVSGLPGLESISLDPKDKKLTLIGDIDPVEVLEEARKLCVAEIIFVGPAKEPEKKKEEDKKDEGKKDGKKEEGGDNKKEEIPQWVKAAYQQQALYNNPMAAAAAAYYQQMHHQSPVMGAPTRYFQHNISMEEDPNSCVIS